jgi:hypothetical protein
MNMGQYIDGLTDEQKDRLVTAEHFNDGWDWWSSGCGCLKGTAEKMDSVATWGPLNADVLRIHNAHDGDVPFSVAPSWLRYPMAVERFGKARVVRAIKLRAGAAVPTEQREPVGAGRG